MISKNDILTRLENGESIDSIASTLTKILNEAQSEYVKKSKKMADAQAVLDHLTAFLDEYYPNLFSGQKITVDEFIACVEGVKAVDTLFTGDSWDAIAKFLKDNNL